MYDQKPKPKPAAPPAPPVPTRQAIDLLKGVHRTAQEAATKKKTAAGPKADTGPETLPANWGLGDLVRVGKSRLTRAIYGPPAEEKY